MTTKSYDTGYGHGVRDFTQSWDFTFRGEPKTAYQRGYAAGWTAAAEEDSAEAAEADRRRALVCRHGTPLCPSTGPCLQR